MRCAVNTVSSASLWCAVALIVCTFPGISRAEDPNAEQANGGTANVEDGKATAPEPVDRSRWLDLYQLDAYLEFEAEWSHIKVEQDSRRRFEPQRSQTNREWTLEERVGLQFSGAAIDPNIINFAGDFAFGLSQARFEEEVDGFDRTDTDHGDLLRYDLRANFFQGKKVSGSVYGLRQDDRINRRFQPTLDQVRNGFGTSWVFSDDKFPMELSYDYLETDRTGNRRDRDDEHYTESTLHYGVDWNIDANQRLKLSLDHSRTEQSFQGLNESFETTRDMLDLTHEWEFGTKKQHDLRTIMHLQDEDGDLARDLFSIGPQLTFRHSENLQTMYKYQFDRERYEGLDISTNRADAQLIHQLFNNLTTTFDVFGLYEDTEDDVHTTQYGASVDWQYNRKNDFGRLYANLALAYDTEETDGSNGSRVILNEAHALRDPLAATLRNRNVILHTIVVTDATNVRVFRSGIDYTIVQTGNATQIARIPTGLIADNETVLVDYQYRTPADGRLDTTRVDASIEQRFDGGFTPYYRFAYRNQEDEASTGFFSRADRTDHHRIGFDFTQAKYTVGAEYEIFDDTVDPYDAYHLRSLVHLLQDPVHTLNAGTRLSHLFFEGGVDDRDVIMLDVELDHRWRLSDTLSTVERISYRLENDSTDGRTHGWDVTAGLEYAVGEFYSEFTFEYDRLSLPDSEEDDFGVFLRIRREFPNVLALR